MRLSVTTCSPADMAPVAVMFRGVCQVCRDVHEDGTESTSDEQQPHYVCYRTKPLAVAWSQRQETPTRLPPLSDLSPTWPHVLSNDLYEEIKGQPI